MCAFRGRREEGGGGDREIDYSVHLHATSDTHQLAPTGRYGDGTEWENSLQGLVTERNGKTN